ncbi:MAG: TonB-dependent receptor [Acidobacteria bacterium]|nr:TonB-dependent receptor [Acidobacteriota bacterium]
MLSPRHLLGVGIIVFPRELRHVTMNTFRPEETTPDIYQTGLSAGIVDRFAIWTNLVVETTLAVRKFEVDVNTENRVPMIYAPASQRGGYFNDQERDVTSMQWVQAFSLSMDNWHGEHVLKFGTDVQRSSYDGESLSRPVEIRRVDGSLAERIEFGGPTVQSVKGTEIAVFAQDRWRLNPRLTFEFGLRLDRDAVIEGVNWSPRAGAAFSVLPEGRGILRGGYGKFVQRTPLNVDAFTSFEARTVTRFEAGGSLVATPVTFAHRVSDPLQTPEAYVGNLEWDQRFGRRVLLKLAGLLRHSSHEYIVNPDEASRELVLSSNGKSRYRELESTIRLVGGARRDLTFSYVWASSTTDLNNYDQFLGNFRNPIVRSNERGPSTADVPHRVLVRGTIGLPWQLDLAPVLEVRSGFPWSAVNEYQDFVGERNRTGRLPTLTTLDMSLVRPWKFKKYRFRAGIRAYNLLGKSAHRDIQTNVTSPFYGTAYNPIERSFGIVLGTAR